MKHTGTKCLETARLLLRPFRAQDGESCLRCWAADPDLYRYISQEPMSPQDVADWLSTSDRAYADPQTYYWAIVEQASGDVIGEIFVDDFSGRNGWCELDWKVGKAFQGKGYATEAARAVLRYLFGEVSFHRVQAKCCVENTASERVMQRIGMVREGVLRDFFLGRDHRRHDVVLYAALSPTVAPAAGAVITHRSGSSTEKSSTAG